MKEAGFVLFALLTVLPAHATEFVKLREHPELRPLYGAANTLYEAATGCRPEEDCVCLRQEKVSRALEHLLKVKVGFPRAVNLFILDERGALKTEHGRGVLVRNSDLAGIEEHLNGCGKHPGTPPETEAQNTLRAIHAAESAFYLRSNQYRPMKAVGYNAGCKVPRELGFKLSGCEDAKLRYTYVVKVSKESQAFVAEARSATGADHPVIPGCRTSDVWTMDQDQQLKNVTSAAAKCPTKRKP